MFIGHLPGAYLLVRPFSERLPAALFPAAMVGSVLPDIDLLAFYFVDNRAHHHHDYLTHRPILWAGMLLVLSFGLHRPGKWGASLAVAALAVAIREHALPFVLLMGAMAFWRRDWKEGAAWTALTVAFLVALAVHLSIVSELVLPSERPSDPWLVMRGLSGWLSTFRGPFFAQFGDRADAVKADVEDLLRSVLCDASGNWTADYVRLRVEAIAV